MKRVILASTNNTVKFEVGNKYRASMLYGGSVVYTVVSRTANTVTLSESHISEDDGESVDDGESTFDIVLKNLYDNEYCNAIGKQEAAEIWEYKGHTGYLFAYDSAVNRDVEKADSDYSEYEDGGYDDYSPSSTRGDYSPSSPWNAPGMSMRDFI